MVLCERRDQTVAAGTTLFTNTRLAKGIIFVNMEACLSMKREKNNTYKEYHPHHHMNNKKVKHTMEITLDLNGNEG